MGEYIAATADSDWFYYAWGDSRSVLVTPEYPQGRPDPDVWSARRPATPVCAGDCDHNGEVTVDEILTLVNIALGTAAASACPAADADGDGTVTIDEILRAVNNALTGC